MNVMNRFYGIIKSFSVSQMLKLLMVVSKRKTQRAKPDKIKSCKGFFHHSVEIFRELVPSFPTLQEERVPF